MRVPTRSTVAVAEDHPVFRRQLLIALERDPGLVVIAEADDLAGLAPRLRHRPDVVLVDASPPAGDAVRALARLAGLDVPSVAMVGPGDDPLVPVLAGSTSVVRKADLLQRGPELVRLAAGGVPLLDADTGRAMLHAAQHHGVARAARQVEVLRQLAAGRDLLELGAWLDQAPGATLQVVLATIMEIRAAVGRDRRQAPAPAGPDGPLPSRQ